MFEWTKTWNFVVFGINRDMIWTVQCPSMTDVWVADAKWEINFSHFYLNIDSIQKLSLRLSPDPWSSTFCPFIEHRASFVRKSNEYGSGSLHYDTLNWFFKTTICLLIRSSAISFSDKSNFISSRWCPGKKTKWKLQNWSLSTSFKYIFAMAICRDDAIILATGCMPIAGIV